MKPEEVSVVTEGKDEKQLQTNNEPKMTKKISDYREGDNYKGKKIKRLYFCNSQKKYIIIKTTDNIVRVCGASPENITHQLAECKYLTESIKSKKAKEWYDYQRATAINAYLIGKEDESKIILKELTNKLQQRQIIKKKILYIGVFLSITIGMLLISIGFSSWYTAFRYTKYIKIATFGAIGGFISLNIKLKDMKFEISESTISYIIVSIYKVVFAMLTAIISYFLIESDLILSSIKNSSTNYLYLVYTIATLAGFSESLLPNIFKNIEGSATGLEEEAQEESRS